MGLVAVTGATGFLGQHLVRTFADAGWGVRILTRRDPVSTFWRGVTPEVVPGDLGDEAALTRLCAGADLVVHAAGLLFGSRNDLQRVNVEGARRLAQAVGPASRVIHVSSLAAREPQLSPYAASKRAGEAAVAEVLGARAVIARPPAIYGPGDRETLRLFRTARNAPLLPVFDPRARIATVHVQDAARQILALADQGAPGPFALCDERAEGYGWREFMETAAAALGRKVRLAHVPAPVLYAAVSVEVIANSWRKNKAIVTFAKVRELTHLDWGIRSDERAPCAPAPEFNLLAGFRHTVGWYRAQGWL